MNNLFNYTDDELVVRYADGDNEAFDVLLKRHESKIYSYIYLCYLRSSAKYYFYNLFLLYNQHMGYKTAHLLNILMLYNT